ncbi:reverse transcriptase domain-containing protein [Tanacetum coccineum]|uniref:Reverse transcriptase domain-containing protein n=1 Tax=Tanacetum coccineum TaxID=301880 RepID=A0ABQ5GHR0_9ASTR
MDDPNITMKEYIRHEEEKARRNGKVYNWETATYGRIWDDDEVHNLRSVETEFPAIVFDDTFTSQAALSCEPTPTVSYFNDVDFHKDFENEFPAITYNDALIEPTISPQHIDEFNLKDETLLSKYDEEELKVLYFNDLFSFNIIYPDNLKSDKDNDDNEIKTKFLSKCCPPARTAKKMEEINNLQQEPDETLYQAWERFKELLMKCPQHYLTEMQEVVLFYNGLDVLTRQILDSKGDIATKTVADAKVTIQEMVEYSKKWNNGTSRTRSTETSDGLAAIQAQLNNLGREITKMLPNSTKTNLRDHVKSISTTVEADMTPIRRIRSSQYVVSAQQNNADITDFEERLGRIYGKEIHRVQVFDFEGLIELMADGLSGRMLMEHRDAQGHKAVLDLDIARALQFQLGGVRRRISWREFILGISSAGDFLGTTPSYTWIRDPMLRLCHMLIACSIAGRSQAPEKVTMIDLFYLREMDVGSVNIPYLLARYLRLFTSGRKHWAMISRVDEGALAILALAQVPQAPTAAGPAKTMAQRLGRLEEDVNGLGGALGEHREVLDSMACDFSQFTTWTVTGLSQMMD